MFKSLNSIDPFFGQGVLLLILLGLLNHFLYLLLRETAPQIVNDDLLLDTSA